MKDVATETVKTTVATAVSDRVNDSNSGGRSNVSTQPQPIENGVAEPQPQPDGSEPELTEAQKALLVELRTLLVNANAAVCVAGRTGDSTLLSNYYEDEALVKYQKYAAELAQNNQYDVDRLLNFDVTNIEAGAAEGSLVITTNERWESDRFQRKSDARDELVERREPKDHPQTYTIRRTSDGLRVYKHEHLPSPQ